MIDLAGTIVREKILARVTEAGFYTILADGTTDIYKVDQFFIVLRYYHNKCLQEDFVDFVDVSGRYMCTNDRCSSGGIFW